MTEDLLSTLDLVGVAVFAVSGALAAARKQMDVFGALVLATVTAVGGGTLRDVLLGAPVFWLEQPSYLWVCAAGATAAVVARRLANFARWPLLVADALGLALFCVLGAQKAAAAGISHTGVVVLGMLTAVAGGMVRDLLCGEVPLVLRREIYATAAFAGAAVFAGSRALGLGEAAAIGLGAGVALTLRLAALRFGLALPVFSHTESSG